MVSRFVNRFHIDPTFVTYEPADVPGGIDWEVWVVRDGDKLLYASLTEAGAQEFLHDHRASLAAVCEHPECSAEISGPDLCLTVECLVCGRVWEDTIDLSDMTEIGQQ